MSIIFLSFRERRENIGDGSEINYIGVGILKTLSSV
jgi:hypothetical protein